jgi:hypothetical protein
MTKTKVVHQFSLFGFQRPVIRLKLGFPKAKMEEAKKLYEKGDYKACAEIVREFREKLEAFESRLSSGKGGC